MVELRVNYGGMDLKIVGRSVGGNFDNDFEMYKLDGKRETLVMSYRERMGKDGYSVEVFSKNILRRKKIEELMCSMLPVLLLANGKLEIHEEGK